MINDLPSFRGRDDEFELRKLFVSESFGLFITWLRCGHKPVVWDSQTNPDLLIQGLIENNTLGRVAERLSSLREKCKEEEGLNVRRVK